MKLLNSVPIHQYKAWGAHEAFKLPNLYINAKHGEQTYSRFSVMLLPANSFILLVASLSLSFVWNLSSGFNLEQSVSTEKYNKGNFSSFGSNLRTNLNTLQISTLISILIFFEEIVYS